MKNKIKEKIEYMKFLFVKRFVRFLNFWATAVIYTAASATPPDPLNPFAKLQTMILALILMFMVFRWWIE